MKTAIEGIDLHLAHPDELTVSWVGQEEAMRQLIAAWMVIDERDVPMNPRLLGKPGVGKTTMAYAAAKRLGRDVYITQATADTRPEDLLITPVIEGVNQLKFVFVVWSTAVSLKVVHPLWVTHSGKTPAPVGEALYLNTVLGGLDEREHDQLEKRVPAVTSGRT